MSGRKAPSAEQARIFPLLGLGLLVVSIAYALTQLVRQLAGSAVAPVVDPIETQVQTVQPFAAVAVTRVAVRDEAAALAGFRGKSPFGDNGRGNPDDVRGFLRSALISKC